MTADLAALTPPLVMCLAFLIGVALLVRHQLAPKRRTGRPEAESEAPQASAEETRRGPADPGYPAKPDKPARADMSRRDANGAAPPDRDPRS